MFQEACNSNVRPLVSIVIPTFNQAGFLEQALSSALSQPYEKLEIIVSDDLSSDETCEALGLYEADRRILYRRNEKTLGRVGNYRRALFNYASGKYVLMLDGDDWLLESDFISQAVEILESDLQVSCVLGDRVNFNQRTGAFKETKNKGISSLKPIMDGSAFFLGKIARGFTFTHFACLYRRELALELDFYREDYLAADMVSVYKLFPGRRVGYLPIRVGVWREHGENASYRSLDEIIANLGAIEVLANYVRSGGFFDAETAHQWASRHKAGTCAQLALSFAKRGNMSATWRLLQEGRNCGNIYFTLVRILLRNLPLHRLGL